MKSMSCCCALSVLLKKKTCFKIVWISRLGTTRDSSFQTFCEQISVIEAQVMYSFGMLDQTWQILKGVLTKNPNSIPSFYLIAQVYIQRGWPDKALNILSRLEDHVYDQNVHKMLHQQCIEIQQNGHTPIHKEAQTIMEVPIHSGSSFIGAAISGCRQERYCRKNFT